MNFFECMIDACNTVKEYVATALGYRNEAGIFAREAESSKDNALNSANIAVNAKNTAITAKDEAVVAKNEVQNIADNIVLPTEATYNKESVDDMFEFLVDRVTENQATLSMLTNN